MDKYFYDTNALLTDCSNITDIAIASKSIEELENIKYSSRKDKDIKFLARGVVREIKEQNPEVIITEQSDYDMIISLGLEINNDNLIIATAYRYNKNNPVVFVTNDVLCSLIAEKYFNLRVKTTNEKKKSFYKGYKEVCCTDEELSQIYSNYAISNIFRCLINEYVIIKNSDDIILDIRKWNGEKYIDIFNMDFNSRQLGKLKPLDIYQRMAFDSISNNDVTVLSGNAGTGKTTIPLGYIMQSLENGSYNKCYIVYSYETLKNQKTLGYVKGDDLTKKLYSSSLGGILASKFGDICEVERLVMKNKINIIPTANPRGIEHEEDSIIFSSESQNLDLYSLKTLIQRCKSGSKLILEGDIFEQCDTARDVGLFKMIDIFKDHKYFGYVKLNNNYRSEIGKLADML